MGAGAWLDIDLLRQRREDYGQIRPQVVSTSSLLRRGAFIGAALPALILLSCGWFVLRDQWLAAEARSLQPAAQEHAGLTSRLQTSQSQIKELKDQNQEVAKAMADVRSSSAFLSELQRIIPTSVELDSVEVKGQDLIVKGLALPGGGFTAVNAFLLSLKGSSFLEPASVTLLQGVLEDQDNRPRLRYELKGTFAADAAQATATRLLALGARGMALRIELMRRLGVLP